MSRLIVLVLLGDVGVGWSSSRFVVLVLLGSRVVVMVLNDMGAHSEHVIPWPGFCREREKGEEEM
jgi:hypothetical protein